jgi:hypothetical protein
MEKYYTCTLLTDVVLNSKLATEGNMTTLDYIPGSNFLGIVAGSLYAKLSPEKSFEIFHSNKVLFGDAYPYDPGSLEKSYPMPFSLFKAKNNKDNATWVHHHLSPVLHESLTKKDIQLKQQRSGYLTPNGHLFSLIPKNFALKSAHDRKTRHSKEGAMFGFESLKKGQTFLFSVHFQDETYLQEVNQALVGTRRIGKSKTAQYGQVEIELLDDSKKPKQISTTVNDNFVLVYAESNLCFFNEYGQSTFQPEAADLGVKGEIVWEKSQIRTYSYSPWNFKRGCSSTQRDCIAKGSVFYLEGAILPDKISNVVGEYQAEGLGRILYNPAFLQGDQTNAEWTFTLKEQESQGDSNATHDANLKPVTPLGSFLYGKKNSRDKELAISEAVRNALKKPESTALREVTSSQWGAIRSFASQIPSMEELRAKLFDEYLSHGVAYDNIWGKNNEKPLRSFLKIFADNDAMGTDFVTKYASEMAKNSKNN